MNGSMNTWTVTRSPSSTTVFLTSRFKFVKSPVVVGRQTCGSTTSAVVRCQLTGCRGVARPETSVLKPCYSRSVLISGRTARTLISHGRVASGGLSTSCLVVAEHHPHQTLTRQHCIASSTTRLHKVHPPLALIYRPSRPFLSAVNSGCSRRFHQLTS